MFWAAFRYDEQTDLIPLDGSVDRFVIFELYNSFLPAFLRLTDIFMQDNAPVHTAGIVQALLEHQRVNLMIWPPLSPDLNPIENL